MVEEFWRAGRGGLTNVDIPNPRQSNRLRSDLLRPLKINERFPVSVIVEKLYRAKNHFLIVFLP